MLRGRIAIVVLLGGLASVADAQPGPTEPPPPGDLGATGLGEPTEPGVEPGTEPGTGTGTEPATGPLLPPSEPLLPPTGPVEPTPATTGPMPGDGTALGQLFRDEPMYHAGLAAIVADPPGTAEIGALPDVLDDRDAYLRLVGDFERYMDQFALDWYRRRERDAYRTFRQQSSTEMDLRRRSRRAAIFYLEQFLRDHPDSPPYTFEAMYRLGDLYWEDEDEMAGREMRAREFTKTIEIYKRLLLEDPGFERRDGVYYVLGFSLNETMTPGYFDQEPDLGVASAIDPNKEEAVAAFLASVCANRVSYPPYRGAVAGPHRVAGAAPEWLPPPVVDPALAARAAPPPASDEYRDLTDSLTPMRDYFRDCRPIVAQGKFNAPTWFVIAKSLQGRYAMEFNDENIEWAISAYRRVLDAGPQNNPYYAIALAEIGHALSGMNRYDEAMEAYRLFLAKLFDGEFSDYQSTAERQKINVLIGIAANLIYDYWLGARHSQTPADRVADQEVVPQDAPYYQELLETLIDECCEEPNSKCDTWQKKAGVYRLFIKRFPLHPKIPQILRKLVDLYRENAGDDNPAARQEMLEAIECLAMFRQSGGPGTGVVASPVAAARGNPLCPDPTVGRRWWDENRDNPELIQEAEEQAEGALQDAAAQYHAAAETHQANCDAGAQDSCIIKDRMFELAIEAYRQLLDEYPSSAFTYDNMFNLATCLYFLGRTDEALAQYRTVEDSTLATTHQRDALGNQITILGNQFATMPNLIPEEPPSHEEPGVDPEHPITVGDPMPLPPVVAGLHEAMERWVQRYPDDPESLGYRHSIAGQLFFLGHWAEAQRMYEELFNQYCGNATQRSLALESWQILSTLAGYAQDRERIEQLRDAAEAGTCFEAGGGTGPTPPPPGGNCDDLTDEGERIRCRITVARLGEEFAAAWDKYEAARASDDPAAYRDAALALLQVVAAHPEHKDSPAAIRVAAVAYGQAREPVLAVETWKKLVDFCSPSGPHVDACEGEGADDPNRVRLPEAYFYIAFNAMQTYDLDEAAQNFAALERSAGRPVRGERLRPVSECISDARRPCTDAEYTAESVRAQADIRRLQGNWNEAGRLTERILNEGYTRSTQEATKMRMDVIDYYRRASAWSDMRRAADAYLTQFSGDPAHVMDILRVRWILYKDAERQNDRRAEDRAIGLLGDAYNRLSDVQKKVVQANFDASQAQLVIEVEEILAEPPFQAIESKFNNYDRLQFEPRTLRTFGDDLGAFKDKLVTQAKELTVAYLAVIRDYPVAPSWGTAARYRISVIWNHLVLTLATLEQRLRAEWLDLQLPSGMTLRDLLDELAAGIRSVVVENGVTIDEMIRLYLIGDGQQPSPRNVVGAVVYARATGVSNEWVRSAIDLVRTLSLTDDTSQLFANGRLPEVTGEALGGGLDPIAQ
ncbi:MAG: hypothetical protein HY905_03140 [Deltaproteobacteria bacterium]|nr:hypothetical protein [Deltaproteobacteria bacterium]